MLYAKIGDKCDVLINNELTIFMPSDVSSILYSGDTCGIPYIVNDTLQDLYDELVMLRGIGLRIPDEVFSRVENGIRTVS